MIVLPRAFSSRRLRRLRTDTFSRRLASWNVLTLLMCQAEGSCDIQSVVGSKMTTEEDTP